MAKQIQEIPLVAINLNNDDDVPIYKQLYNSLRKAILERKLKPGQKLPGTRSLAHDLKISRNTVSIAFNQLLIEGYISGRTGSGTYVNDIPDELLKVHPASSKDTMNNETVRMRNKPVLPVIRNSGPDEILPFQTGLPAVHEFPVKIWLRIINQVSQTISTGQLGYGDAAGYRPLREAISSYLNTYRAVECTADQIIITSGSQQGLDLTGRVLLRPGSSVWLEDPGYFGARSSMIFAKANVIPVPLDAEGMNIHTFRNRASKPELIYTTPSHQFPLGYTMSVARRLALLQFADKTKSWIVEDDYDGEFRYSGTPLPSLQGMDKSGRVIYLGTFSKVLFPGLRLAYIVLPNSDMMKSFASAKFMMDRQCPIYEQIVLTRFIDEGHFTRHIRKMRMLYKARQEFLINEIRDQLHDMVTINDSPAGMHLILWLPEHLNDKEIAVKAAENNVIVRALSDYSIKYFSKSALVLGYTAFNNEELAKGVRVLKNIIKNS